LEDCVPDTFQALGVLVLALLPGALYVWSFERLAGAWGIKLADRLLRFIGVSAVLHVTFLPITYRLRSEFVRSGRVADGTVPLIAWPALILYVAVPIAGGTLVGWGTRGRHAWARWFTGPDPAPRAWDDLFGSRPDGWIRLRLRSGSWLAGAYAKRPDGSRSYAAGYPEEQDLYLIEAMDVDPDTGEFLFGDDGYPVSRGSGILVRWSEVEYLEFIEA
jgi:Family of unknown function (DUF6338)